MPSSGAGIGMRRTEHMLFAARCENYLYNMIMRNIDECSYHQALQETRFVHAIRKISKIGSKFFYIGSRSAG